MLPGLVEAAAADGPPLLLARPVELERGREGAGPVMKLALAVLLLRWRPPAEVELVVEATDAEWARSWLSSRDSRFTFFFFRLA
jgi:hypothetical protein